MHPDISPYIYIIFTGATAIGVLIQAGVLLGLFLGFRRLQGKLELILTHITDHALPLIASSKVTLEELSPKLKTISSNLVDISETLKHESQNVKVSVDDVLEKTRAQTARVDEMVSGTLDGISHASAVIQQGVEVPLRHLYGIFNGLRAGFSTFRGKKREEQEPVAAAAAVQEEFVAVVEGAVSERRVS
jgi:hypothetical protein